MSDALDLLIVIINYKTGLLVIDCLQTVIPQLQDGQQIVIVDNCSADGSAAVIQQWIDEQSVNERVQMILSPQNTGFSGGNNLGIQSRQAEFYLLLNSDTLMREGALQILLDTARQNPDAGMVSPRLEWPNGDSQISCFRYHSPISELIYAAGSAPVTAMFRSRVVAIPVQDEKTNPEWTSFACVMVSAALIEDIGLMDDGYFLYYEDVDYCRMARDRGWKIINNPAARVVHLRGGSSDVKKNIERKSRLPKYYYASRTRYFAKHYGRIGLGLANMLWLTGRSIAFVRECLGKKTYTSCEKQHLDIWTNFSSPMQPERNPR